MADRLVTGLILVAILALAGLAAFYPRPAGVPPGENGGNEKVFYLSARIAEDGGFNLSEIRVQEGDHVVLYVRSLDTTHGVVLQTPWVFIRELVPPGAQRRVEFDAAQPGTYQILCPNPLCSPLHHEMMVDLIIE